MSLIDIQAGILRAIAKATSKHPARADEVLARMIDKGDDSITPPLAQRALEALVSSKCVTTAHVQRMKTDKEPWLAIWPTGLPLAPQPWQNTSHSALFVRTPNTRQALAIAHAPRSRPAPASTDPEKPEVPQRRTRHRGNANRAAILEVVIGRCAADALLISEIARHIGITASGAQWLLDGMSAAGSIATTDTRPVRIYDPQAEHSRRAEAQARVALVHASRNVLPVETKGACHGRPAQS